MASPISDASRVLLRNYRPLKRAEQEAWTWLDGYWRRVLSAIDESPPWNTVLWTGDSVPRSEKGQAYGITVHSKTKGLECQIYAGDARWVGSHEPEREADLVRVLVTMQNMKQVKRLRERIGAPFDSRLRDLTGWKAHLDASQVLWSLYVPLDFDTGSPTATVSAVNEAILAYERLCALP